MKTAFGKIELDKSGTVHFHNSDERFCGTRKMGRRFSFNLDKITCERCAGNIAVVLTEQGKQTLRDLGYEA